MALTSSFNLLAPVADLLIESLEQPVTGGIGGTGIEVPTIEGIAHTFENLFAGSIIDFDPFTEGSPACPALCDNVHHVRHSWSRTSPSWTRPTRRCRNG